MTEIILPKDGWDLGILISMRRHSKLIPFDTINSDLIAEMGWLDEEDLRERLDRLTSGDYLIKGTINFKDPIDGWKISPKGLSIVSHPENGKVCGECETIRGVTVTMTKTIHPEFPNNDYYSCPVCGNWRVE